MTWQTIHTIASMAFSVVLSLAAQGQDGVALSTATFGTQSTDKSPDGKPYAYLYDVKGNLLKTILLEDHQPQFGRLGGYALISNDFSGPTRTVQFFDEQGSLRATFEMDKTKHPLLGKDVFALIPRVEHGPPNAFDVQFYDYQGKLLNEYSPSDARLSSFRQAEGGRWIYTSLQLGTDSTHVVLFEPDGKLRWSFDTQQKECTTPIIAVSTTGNRSALALWGLETPNYNRTLLTILDGEGHPLVSDLMVSGLQVAAFSPDEKYFVQAGSGGTYVRRSDDGALVWGDATQQSIARRGLKCHPDNSGFFALSLKQDEDADDLVSAVLTQHSFSSSTPLFKKTIATNIDETFVLVDLLVDEPASVTVVTSTGRLTIDKSSDK